MTKELLARVYQGIRNYSGSDKDLAEDFIRNNLFSTFNSAFQLEAISGWHVLELNDFEDSVVHLCETEEQANRIVKEIYGHCEPKFITIICYRGDIGYEAKAGKKSKSRVQINEGNARELLIEKGVKNITATLTKIKNSQKSELETGIIKSNNPNSIEEAKKKRLDLLKELGLKRGEQIEKLVVDDGGNKRLMSESEWDKISAEPYPSFNKMKTEIDSMEIDYSTLLALDKFLSEPLDAPLAFVLAKVHSKLAVNYGENAEKRPTIGGEGSGSIGKTLESNMISVLRDMAIKGFDMQPIFDNSGKCIASIRLKDVAGFLTSARGRNIPHNTTIKYLLECDLLLSPPPQLGGEADLSDAAAILSHGTEAVLVNFDPENWFGCEEKLEVALSVLTPGLHIMTSHDVITYQLLNK